MLRHLKTLSLLGCLALSVDSSHAFSLLGPNNEPWQTPEIGYNPQPYDPLATAPKNIGEEYRRNTPVLYYTFDANFLEYFGTNGVDAVEKAIAIYNQLTNVSSYSKELTEFPMAVSRENYTASALYLNDIKSFTMNILIEQLGLAAPERYVWNIHDRFAAGPAPCPDNMEYFVVKRNWDPIPSPLNQFQASSYVNGVLYSYYILEYCSAPPTAIAEAVEFPVDPLDMSFTSVASGLGASVVLSVGGGGVVSGNTGLLYPGVFYTGLTRDDVGGLRYLLRANNYNWETPGPTSLSLITNQTPLLVTTSNLTLFAAQALTNSGPAMQTLYPGLGVTYSTNYFVTTWVTNVIPYFTNSPYDPAGTAPRIAFLTNRTLVFETRYQHAFENLFTVTNWNNQWQAVPVTNLNDYLGYGFNTVASLAVTASRSPYTPAGSFALTTNVNVRTFATNTVVGEFFIMPAGACEVVLLAPQLTTTNAYANLLVSITNTVSVSNAVTVTNITESYDAFLIDYSTNHVFLTLPVTCSQTNQAITAGIERIRFERRDYDSLIGRFYSPFTNSYTLTAITNNSVYPLRVLRPVAQPDFLFTAVDAPLTPGPGADPGGLTSFSRNINFSTNTLGFYPGLAGPGTIEAPTTVTFNKGGPIYYNLSRNAYYFDRAENSQTPALIWGSFDGTTNAPVIYPNGASLASLEDALFFQISPAALPEGNWMQPYATTTLTVAGGTPPYRWALAPNSPALPPGIVLSPSGTISGTPTQRATFDFILRVTDATGRFVDRPYSIKINW